MSADMDDLIRSLGRIEGKLDGIFHQLESAVTRHDDLERRVNEVERKVWYGVGIASALGIIASQFKGLFHP